MYKSKPILSKFKVIMDVSHSVGACQFCSNHLYVFVSSLAAVAGILADVNALGNRKSAVSLRGINF